MLKKPLLRCLLSFTALVGVMLSNASYAVNSTGIPASQAEKSLSDDAGTASSSASTPAVFDRSGVDRASVHLQIFQQSNSHFSDNNMNKKAGSYDKKPVSKNNRES